jgi:hypothetical protein
MLLRRMHERQGLSLRRALRLPRIRGESTMPNYCVSGSDCRVDADCGPGGFCSPSQFDQWCGPTYHCRVEWDAG